MLNIEIVSGNPDGSLVLRENGHTNNGNSAAERTWFVNWKVRPGSNVEYIHDIKMKTGPGVLSNTNIFSNDPPRPQGGPNSKHWKGKVNSNAPVNAQYNYSIFWKPAVGNVKEYDPKISVKPSKFNITALVVGISLGVLGILSLAYLFRRRSRK
jgi:hypothetical protein